MVETAQKTDCKQQLRDQCAGITHDIENGKELDCCPECGGEIKASFSGAECLECSWTGDEYMSAMDYLSGVLDIEYRVGSDREYRSAKILVAFGGPNIWIDTSRKVVIGAWWSDYCEVSYDTDAIGLDEALEELWGCS